MLFLSSIKAFFFIFFSHFPLFFSFFLSYLSLFPPFYLPYSLGSSNEIQKFQIPATNCLTVRLTSPRRPPFIMVEIQKNSKKFLKIFKIFFFQSLSLDFNLVFSKSQSNGLDLGLMPCAKTQKRPPSAAFPATTFQYVSPFILNFLFTEKILAQKPTLPESFSLYFFSYSLAAASFE